MAKDLDPAVCYKAVASVEVDKAQVAAALAGIRGAKSNAKVSMRAELARVEIAGPRTLVEAAELAADDQQIAPSRRGAEGLASKARQIVPWVERWNHLDGAAGEPEQQRPDAQPPGPVEDPVVSGGEDGRLGRCGCIHWSAPHGGSLAHGGRQEARYDLA